ncbi:MAG: hypothetical protein WBN08_03415, partial [Thiogranum sp.]
GELASELSDSDTGQLLTILYLAWPAGLQKDPVCQFPFMYSGSLCMANYQSRGDQGTKVAFRNKIG